MPAHAILSTKRRKGTAWLSWRNMHLFATPPADKNKTRAKDPAFSFDEEHDDSNNNNDSCGCDNHQPPVRRRLSIAKDVVAAARQGAQKAPPDNDDPPALLAHEHAPLTSSSSSSAMAPENHTLNKLRNQLRQQAILGRPPDVAAVGATTVHNDDSGDPEIHKNATAVPCMKPQATSSLSVQSTLKAAPIDKVATQTLPCQSGDYALEKSPAVFQAKECNSAFAKAIHRSRNKSVPRSSASSVSATLPIVTVAPPGVVHPKEPRVPFRQTKTTTASKSMPCHSPAKALCALGSVNPVAAVQSKDEVPYVNDDKANGSGTIGSVPATVSSQEPRRDTLVGTKTHVSSTQLYSTLDDMAKATGTPGSLSPAAASPSSLQPRHETFVEKKCRISSTRIEHPKESNPLGITSDGMAKASGRIESSPTAAPVSCSEALVERNNQNSLMSANTNATERLLTPVGVTLNIPARRNDNKMTRTVSMERGQAPAYGGLLKAVSAQTTIYIGAVLYLEWKAIIGTLWEAQVLEANGDGTYQVQYFFDGRKECIDTSTTSVYTFSSHKQDCIRVDQGTRLAIQRKKGEFREATVVGFKPDRSKYQVLYHASSRKTWLAILGSTKFHILPAAAVATANEREETRHTSTRRASKRRRLIF